ncbi:MAG: 3-oxoacyl-[acyl-carrier protein] reductase [Frankiaceae bacterium]|nr:3-oxoacyl-[acyl-carrier protein] reductase [Frankiaceae bacterium]
MDLGLADRVYVVTGGTKGLGFATAEALVADDARVVVSSRDQRSVDDAVASLGERARGLVADNAEPSTPDRLAQTALDTWGRLDGALISVGGPPGTSALGATDDQWRAAFESVFLGAVRSARAIVPNLGEGAVIGFVLSTSVKQPIEGIEISNGLRPGLAMWAKELADELGPRGIRVFSLMPGRISTGRIKELMPDPDTRARVAQSIPLRRFGEPAEFGQVAAFLLSPAASYLTGLAVPVDGGSLRSL